MSDLIAVLDLEYTAWEGSRERNWSGPGEHREIVEIGLLLLRGPLLAELASLSLLVKPECNPVLSDYFKRLTGISQHEVDTAVGLAAAGATLASCLRELSGANDTPLWCFGEDGEIFLENYSLIGAPSPLGRSRFQNIRPALCAALGLPALGVDSSQIPGALGIPVDAHHHRAIHDCRAVAIGLREAARRGIRIQ